MIKETVILLLIFACSKVSFAQFSDSTHYYVKYASTGSINRTKDGKS